MQSINETLQFFGLTAIFGFLWLVFYGIPALKEDYRDLRRTRWKLNLFAQAVDMCGLEDESFIKWLEIASGINEPYEQFYSVRGDGGPQSCSLWPRKWLIRWYRDELKFRCTVFHYCLDHTESIRNRLTIDDGAKVTSFEEVCEENANERRQQAKTVRLDDPDKHDPPTSERKKGQNLHPRFISMTIGRISQIVYYVLWLPASFLFVRVFCMTPMAGFLTFALFAACGMVVVECLRRKSSTPNKPPTAASRAFTVILLLAAGALLFLVVIAKMFGDRY